MKKINLKFNLPVSFLQEGEQIIAYTPALDLSTCGKTYEQAKKRFEEVVDIFFAELVENGTLEDVLTNAGWKKAETQWNPPVVISQELQSVSVCA